METEISLTAEQITLFKQWMFQLKKEKNNQIAEHLKNGGDIDEFQIAGEWCAVNSVDTLSHYLDIHFLDHNDSPDTDHEAVLRQICEWNKLNPGNL